MFPRAGAAAPPLTPLIPRPVRRLYRRVFPHKPPDAATLWRKACQKWVVAGAEPYGDQAAVHGWLIADPAVRPHVGFRLNGGRPTRVEFPLPRPDVADRWSRYSPAAADSGFLIWTDALGRVDLTIEAVDERTGQPLGGDYLSVSVPSADRLGPVPDGAKVRRVIGEPSSFSFGMGGFTAFRRIEAAVRAATGQELPAFPRVLDWGCGCGRVGRYFLPLSGVRVTGVDVDAENINWSREHLPSGTWDVIPLRPPTNLPTAGFDLVCGVSVLTHLKEQDQFAWLEELRRVVRPGGLVLMTFHGAASVVWSGLSAERYAVLARDGICDQENPIYDAALSEADYYRDTFHTDEYVRAVWGRYFDVLAVRPSFVAHQDLAVLRRR